MNSNNRSTVDVAKARGAKKALLLCALLAIVAIFLLEAAVANKTTDTFAPPLAELLLLIGIAYQYFLWRLSAAIAIPVWHRLLNVVLCLLPLCNLLVFAQILRLYSRRTQIPINFLMLDRPRPGSPSIPATSMNGWQRLWVFASLFLILPVGIHTANQWGRPYLFDPGTFLARSVFTWAMLCAALYVAGVGVRWVMRGFQGQSAVGLDD